MQIVDILSIEQIECAFEANSKKSALEKISELLCKANDSLSNEDVFNQLIQRERLGSTGLGHGIAIPHSRMENNEKTIAAFIQIAKGVDYDAPDSQPVDLFFSLLVPEESTQEHLEILAKLAEKFSDQTLVEQLRKARDKETIYTLLTG